MKNIRKIFVIISLMLVSLSGMLFGCADKYSDMKIETDLDSNQIELFLGDDLTETQKSSITFNASVSGVGANVSTILKYNLSGNNLVTIDFVNNQATGKTEITLNALNFGQTNLTLLTEEGGKTLDISLKVTSPIKSLENNTESGYKPFAVAGQTTKINTAKAITYLPASTTQREIQYSIVGSYSGVEVLADGTIIADENASSGTFKVKATSLHDSGISTEFDVKVLQPINNIVVEHNGQELTEEDVLKLSTNMLEESYKIIEITAQTNENYNLNLEFVDNVGNSISVFNIEQINENQYGITAIRKADAKLKITASIEGYEYLSSPRYVDVISVETPSSITVSTKQTDNPIIVYDTYKNGLGEAFTINIGGANADDRRFVVRINNDDRDKFVIYNGKYDVSTGNLVEVKPYTDGSTDFDIIKNETIIYIKALSNGITGNNGYVSISFVAYGSMGLMGQEVSANYNINLKRGISELEIGQNLQANYLMVPVKQSDNEEGVKLAIQSNASEYTKFVKTDFENSGLLLQDNEVLYENGEKIDDKKVYTFTLFGVKPGIYNLSFYAQNGKYVDVKVRVFVKITDITLTTSTIEQNSDIAQINYETQNNLPTLVGGSLTLKKGGYANLNINAYNGKNLQSCDYKSVRYEYDSTILRMDNSGKMFGYAKGETDVVVRIVAYDNEDENTDTKEFELTFHLKVDILIQSASLNSNFVTIYTKNSLGDYEENGLTDKQRYGEFEFDIKINPEATELTEDCIKVKWTGADVSSLVIEPNFNFENRIYKIKVSCDSLSGIKTEGSAKFTITISQYQRTIVKEATILIKTAQKVQKILNVKKVQDGITSNVPKQANVLPITNASGEIESYDEEQEYLYVYFDSRNITQDSKFTFVSQIYPLDALNQKLVYVIDEYKDYKNILSVRDNMISVQKAGITNLYICSADSYDASKGSADKYTSYDNYVQVVVKVADGLSKFTALDITSASDLMSINNNVESLSKFYVIKKDINIIASSWTPIGYINGEMHAFEGNIDGLISKKFGEKVVARINGINFRNFALEDENQYCGLFGIVGENAILENFELQINTVNLTTQNENVNTYIGGISAINNGIIQNLSVNFVNNGKNFETDVNLLDASKALYFGAISAVNNKRVFNCYADGYINIEKNTRNSIYNIGGLIGLNSQNSVLDGNTNFFNKTEFNSEYNSLISIKLKQNLSSNQNVSVGGVAGTNIGEIKYSSFDGIIIANNNVGGIAGINQNRIYNTYSTGKISGNENIGGLVGYALGTSLSSASISNSSVNMFDDGNDVSSIVGLNNVGGLVGKSQYLDLQNAYARSYKKASEGFVGDLQVEGQSQSYVGGVVGYAENTNLYKVYSRISINAQNSIFGGVVGYANSVDAQNVYERNQLIDCVYNGLAIGKAYGSNNSINYFYGAHSFDYIGSGDAQVDNVLNSNNISNVASLWSTVLTTSNNKDSWGNADWYLSNDDEYPYIIFGNKDVLTVEAPKEIVVLAKEHSYLSRIEYIENGETKQLVNTYALFRNGLSTLSFADLFDVSVEPQNSILNISSVYSLVSSNPSILQVVGKTPGSYRIKLYSTGKVILTIASKLDSNVKVELILYVINIVKDFKITPESATVFVDNSQELKINVAENFENNTNFYVKFTKNSRNFAINNNFNDTLQEFGNNEKIYITANKSGSYELDYTLISKIIIDNNEYEVFIPNLIGESDEIEKVVSRTLTFDFVYGIKSFVCDTTVLETGLNDSANIKYTLTGDDLRYLNTNRLPLIKWYFAQSELASCWNVQLLYANVYRTLDSSYETIYFNPNNLPDKENTIEDYLEYENRTFAYAISKVEFVFRVLVNEDIAKAKMQELIFTNNSSETKLLCYFNCSVSIAEEVVSEEFATNFVVNRQKLDNINLDFYMNAEKTFNDSDIEVYTINEMPSRAITSGNEGILKIHLAPINAEINEVVIKYSNAGGYNLSMRQMLYNTTETDAEKQGYIERRPYAVAVENGKGLVLYKESNYYNDNNITDKYNSYLYVALLIPSSVPSGQIFTITVEAIFTTGYHLTQTTELVSKLPSKLNIQYDFNGQRIDDFAYIPENKDKSFFVDFTELLDDTNLSNVENIDELFEIVGANENASKYISLDEEKEIQRPTASTPYFRVYYKITTDTDLSLRARMSKTENNVETVVISNILTLKCVPFVVTGVTINDNGNNLLIVSQTKPRDISAKLIYEYDTTLEETDEKYISIKNSVEAIETDMTKTLSYWFARKQGEIDYTILTTDDGSYLNFRVLKVNKQSGDSEKFIALSGKIIDTSVVLYCELGIKYNTENNLPVSQQPDAESKIGDHEIGLVKLGDNNYIQYLQDDITVNFVRDVSEESAIPIEDEDDFNAMVNGSEGHVVYYALNKDIVLNNYQPKNLEYVSLNGNMHTITINSFDTINSQENEDIVYRSNYGLFTSIDQNSVVKHLTVHYNGLVAENVVNVDNTNELITYNKDDNNQAKNIDFNLTDFYFAGLSVVNYGIIYNVSIEGSELSFVNNISNSSFVAGLVVTNSGYISYSKSSLPLKTNCGQIAGLVLTNSKKISNCKVVLENEKRIENTLSTSTNTLTGGFVAKNSGEIFGSYITTQNGIAYGSNNSVATVKSNSNVGGFVNENTGIISNCYSNIAVSSETRSSGFVYNNSGDITSSYSSSKIESSSVVHTPFTGTDNKNLYLNTGNINDCYYIGEYGSYKDTEYATQVELDNANSKSNYNKFVFTENNDDYFKTPTGIWRMENGLPHLVDADLNIHSYQYLDENNKIVEESSSVYKYNWQFIDENDHPTVGFGEGADYGGKYRINPRIITDISTWNDYILVRNTNDNEKNYFVVVKDISAKLDDNIASSQQTFHDGVLLGSNMEISNLYLRATQNDISKTFGLFGTVSNSYIKDLNISVKQIAANNSNCVGILAGYINNSKISNINIDAADVVIQGRIMVGGFAGIINNSQITKVDVIGSVNASYKSNLTTMYNYVDSDLKVLVDNQLNSDIENQSNTDYELYYSYAGVFAGAIIGNTSVAKYINITGDNKVIGYYAGGLVGLIGQGAQVVLGSVIIAPNQYIRAYSIGAGLVGENRGIIDRCYVENANQQAIDVDTRNTLTTDRNMTFFVGSPIFVGGLVGFNNGGTIKNSYSKLDVRTENYVTKASGGLVGLDVGGNIDCCYATGSVINRYIIGGIIGVLTNKNFLLGYYEELENITRNDNDDIFATNFEYISSSGNNKENTEIRGTYIAGNIDDDLDELDESALDRAMVNKLSITNTIASNKWLQNTDVNILSNVDIGFVIGSIVSSKDENNDEKIKNTFDSSNYVLIDDKLSFKTFENNNYINTQSLFGTSTTIKTIKLTDILKSIIDYDSTDDNKNDDYYSEVDDNDIKQNLLNAIDYASLGATNINIVQSFDDHNGINYKLATCVVNNVVFSFENILKIDEIMLRKYEFVKYELYYGSKITNEDYKALAGSGLLYIKVGGGNDEADFSEVYNAENNAYQSIDNNDETINTYEAFASNIANCYVQYQDGYREAVLDDYFVNAENTNEVINLANSQNLYVKAGIGYFKLFNLIANEEAQESNGKYYFRAENIDNYFDELKNNGCLYERKEQNGEYVFSPLSDDQTYYTLYTEGLNEIRLNNSSLTSTINLKSNEEYYQLSSLLVMNGGSVQHKTQSGQNFVLIRVNSQSLFNTLKPYLYRAYADNKLYTLNDDNYIGAENLYLNYDNSGLKYYKLETSAMYIGNSYYVRNNEITFYTLGDYYIKVIGLYGKYNEKYFILPNKEVSTTRFYPEIIVNINE